MTDPARYMSGSEGAESAPQGDTSDWLAAEFVRMDRRARENAKRKPKSPEQKARDAVNARLRKCGRGIESLAASLDQVHADKSGNMHWAMLPLFQDVMPALQATFDRIEREAAAGCELSAAFVAEYGELLRLCEHMRHEKPPPRAPDYDPLATLTPAQRRWIKEAG